MLDITKMPIVYWSIQRVISYIQRRIIVYSIMYYEYDDTCITDKQYDSFSKQLVDLKNKHKEEYKQSEYYYAMYDFDGHTGYDVYSRLTEKDRLYLSNIASHILSLYKKETRR